MDEKREQGKLPGWTWAVNIVPTVIATAMVGACLQFDLSWWVGVPIAAAIVLAGLLWERAIEQSISRRNNNPNESEKHMKSSAGFKRPTIKATSRAYVRLFECFRTPEEWLSFLSRFRVEHPASGMQRNGDCAVRVIDLSTGDLATLGLEIPNEIKYHTYIATARSFWTESFTSATQRRRRVWEIGYSQPSTDEVFDR